MKTICLNFQEIKKSHFIYALYIIHTLESKYSYSNVKCLMNKSTKQYIEETCKLDNILFSEDQYEEDMQTTNVGAAIEWDGNSNIVTKIEDGNSKLVITSNKQERLFSRSKKPEKWMLYEEANSIITILNIKNYSYLEFVKLLPKKEWLTKLTEQAIDKNKTIIYVSLPKKEINSQLELMFTYWLNKILETESVAVIIKTNITFEINHPYLFNLKEDDVNIYDDIHLINAVDTFVGLSGDLEQVAVFLKKPIFLFIENYDWNIKDNSCWINYLKLCNIRNSNTLSEEEINRLAEKSYLLFSDLIYEINLNIKLSAEQLWNLHYAVENPIAMLFFNADEGQRWRERNKDYEQWVIPVIEEKWSIKRIKKLVKESNLNKLVYIFGDITWHNLLVFKMMSWKNKAVRSINWVNNQFYKHVSAESLIDGLQVIKEKEYHEK